MMQFVERNEARVDMGPKSTITRSQRGKSGARDTRSGGPDTQADSLYR